MNVDMTLLPRRVRDRLKAVHLHADIFFCQRHWFRGVDHRQVEIMHPGSGW